MRNNEDDRGKVLVTCPICGFRAVMDDFSNDNEVCEQCGRSTYTFRTVDSIRNVFVGELKKKRQTQNRPFRE